MKAILFTKYGSPDVLEFREVERPAPKDNEVLVKVYAASVNALEWRPFTFPLIFVRLRRPCVLSFPVLSFQSDRFFS